MRRLCLGAIVVATLLASGAVGMAPARAASDPTALQLSNTEGVFIAAIGAALIAKDCVRSSPPKSHAGQEMATGLVLTMVATQGLKYVVRQKRPFPSEDVRGFPSGHTSMAFCFARIIDNLDNRWGLPAYAYAVGIGWARRRNRDHTFAQVVAGALVGQAAGVWTVHNYQRRFGSGRGGVAGPRRFVSDLSERITVLPTVGGEEKDTSVDPTWGLNMWQKDF